MIGGLGGGSGGGGGRRVATETRDEDVDEAVEVVEQLRTHQHYQAQNDKIHFQTPEEEEEEVWIDTRPKAPTRKVRGSRRHEEAFGKDQGVFLTFCFLRKKNLND